MPRGRFVLLGVLIALVSIALTALVILFVAPFGFRSGPGTETDRGGGEARDVVFDPDETLDVVVALQRLPRGFTIPADAVGVRTWPAAAVPVDAVVVQPGEDADNVIEEQVAGKIAFTDIEREQPLLRAHLVESLSEIADSGSVIPAILPPGTRAYPVPVSDLTSIAYAVKPGDRVDVIFSFIVLDVNSDTQSALPDWIQRIDYGGVTDDTRTTAQVIPEQGGIYGRIDTIPPGELANIIPSEAQRPRLVTQTIVNCAAVTQVGDTSPLETGESGADRQDESAPRGGPPAVVFLALSRQEVNVLEWAIHAQVKIGLSICPVQDEQSPPPSSVTLQYIFETYNVPVPPRLPYALEPSLRDAPTPRPGD